MSKCAPKSTNAGNLISLPYYTKNIFRGVRWIEECENVHLNQSCRKFDEMPKSANRIFLTVWSAEGEGCQNVHLNQSCGKFDKMPKSTKKKKEKKKKRKIIFFTVWPMGRGLGGRGCQNVHLNQKLLGNLMKCLNPLKIFFELFDQ